MSEHQAHNLIAGLPVPALSGETLPVIDPSFGEEFGRIARSRAEDVDAAVKAARQAYDKTWSRLSALERGRLLTRLAGLVFDRIEELGAIESRDTGKPLKQGRADALACARYFEFYGGAADKIHGETIPFLDGYTVFAHHEPFGVTGHIVPWNYPLQIGARNIGATLAAGNCAVIKPAEDASLSLIRLAELALEAGIPAGVLNVVSGLGAEAGAALAGHSGVDHISFTGSNATGTLIQMLAAKNNVPVLLELGGKSPQIVFADGDVDEAVPFIVNGIVQNAGQTCSAGSRLLIEGAIFDDVIDKVAQRLAATRVGTSAMDLDCGPIINRRQHERVSSFLSAASERGIATAAQGSLASGLPAGGFFIAPTLLYDVPAHDTIAHCEVFGPVLAAIRFDTEQEALSIANGTPYGLVAAVWTRDGGRQLRMARGIRAGQVFVNNFGAGGGVELPFGGMKRSGFGREKGIAGLKALTLTKTIAIKHG